MPDVIDVNDWLTTEQVCTWLNVKRDWLYDQVAARKIPHHKLNRTLRFRRTELELWLEEQKR